MGKSGSSLADIDMGHRRGQGGCAILWHKSLDSFVQPMPNLGSDRICVIKLIINGTLPCYIIAVF